MSLDTAEITALLRADEQAITALIDTLVGSQEQLLKRAQAREEPLMNIENELHQQRKQLNTIRSRLTGYHAHAARSHSSVLTAEIYKQEHRITQVESHLHRIQCRCHALHTQSVQAPGSSSLAA